MNDAPVVDTRPPWKKKSNIGAALVVASQAGLYFFPQYAVPLKLILTAGLVLFGIGVEGRASRYLEAFFKAKNGG